MTRSGRNRHGLHDDPDRVVAGGRADDRRRAARLPRGSAPPVEGCAHLRDAILVRPDPA